MPVSVSFTAVASSPLPSGVTISQRRRSLGTVATAGVFPFSIDVSDGIDNRTRTVQRRSIRDPDNDFRVSCPTGLRVPLTIKLSMLRRNRHVHLETCRHAPFGLTLSTGGTIFRNASSNAGPTAFPGDCDRYQSRGLQQMDVHRRHRCTRHASYLQFRANRRCRDRKPYSRQINPCCGRESAPFTWTRDRPAARYVRAFRQRCHQQFLSSGAGRNLRRPQAAGQL